MGMGDPISLNITGVTKGIYNICLTTSCLSVLISGLAIALQLMNYRKPFEQRLIVRILVVVPMFSITCYCAMINDGLGSVLEPIREIYEAFVIYTFYKLLVLMLGGERHIIQMTVDKPAINHPIPMNLILGEVHISDPSHFLTIKRCILQYVWVKPLIYLVILLTSLLGVYDTNDISITSPFLILGVVYNLSATLSLYYLAMFWRCFYDELKPFNPWKKFLCVKLIIFASYWQGLLIGILNWIGVFHEVAIQDKSNLKGKIQNGLLCIEMIFFAWLHWNSFPYTEYSSEKLYNGARIKTWIAFKDWISFGDLIHDIKMTTLNGDSYNLRNFDSKTDLKVYAGSETFNKKIYQGLRMSSDGKRYWINNVSTIDKNDTNSISGERRIKVNRSIGGSQLIANQKTPLLNNSIFNSSQDSFDEGTYLDGNKDNRSVFSFNEEEGNLDIISIDSDDYKRDEKLYKYVRLRYLSDDEINYPVLFEYSSFEYSDRITMMRRSLQEP